MALHFSKFHAQIDAERFWSILRENRCDVLMSNLLWIMVRHGGFCAEDFPGIGEENPALMEAILSDLEVGGYMGGREFKQRSIGGLEYYRRTMLKTKSPAQYVTYIFFSKVRAAMGSMFLSRRELAALYPWVQKFPIAAPFAWAYQAIHFPIVKVHSGALKRDIRTERSATNNRKRASNCSSGWECSSRSSSSKNVTEIIFQAQCRNRGGPVHAICGRSRLHKRWNMHDCKKNSLKLRFCKE